MKLSRAPHDLHWLPNGNILTHQGTEIVEVDPRRSKIVWKFDVAKIAKAKRIEVHSVAPLPENLIMVAISGEGKILEIDRRGEVQHSIAMQRDKPDPHRDTRLVRPLGNGNYLVAHEGDGAVREYDRDGQVVWEFKVPMFGKQARGGHGPEAFGNSVFSAVTVGQRQYVDRHRQWHSILEVNHQKEIVWKVEQNDLQDITLAWVTTLEVFPMAP